MRQQQADVASRMRLQACQHILQVAIRVVPIKLGRLDEAHDRRSSLTRRQGPGEQPVLASSGSWAYLLLVKVVVDRQRRVV